MSDKAFQESAARLLQILDGVPTEPVGEHLTAEEIFDYVKGRLRDVGEQIADAHLESCDGCLSLVAKLLEDEEAASQTPRLATVLHAEQGIRLHDLLERTDAIQTGFDYRLPSGGHVGVHVESGRLCHSEDAMDSVARIIRARLRDLKFTCLLSHGWPMAAIARRVAWLSSERSLRLIETEGSPPSFSAPVLDAEEVVVLVDVVITGAVVRQLEGRVRRSGARVVHVLSLVGAEDVALAPGIEAILSLHLGWAGPAECERCGHLEAMDFNPFSYRMTHRKTKPRSPSEFLQVDPKAARLWEAMLLSGAYQRHRIDGHVHYNGFVDTEQLLMHPVAGSEVVRELCGSVLRDSPAPDVIVVPQRRRSQLLAARMLDNIFEMTGLVPVVQPVLLRGGNPLISDATASSLRGRQVLICDSAVASGATIDALSHAVLDAGGMISVAVLISRLKESSEEAMAARLNGHFTKLFYFPTSFHGVDGTDRANCPTCAARAEVHTLAGQISSPSIAALSAALEERQWRTPKVWPVQTVTSCGAESFLIKCQRRMAGGLAIHALAAAMNDGMAPFDLPEVLDRSLRPEKRAAILDALPQGSLRGSRQLERRVQACLSPYSDERVWMAAANFLTREGRSDWVDKLHNLLRRRRSLSRRSWGWLTFDACKLIQDDPSVRPRLQKMVANQLRVSRSGAIRAGLEEVSNAIAEVLEEAR